MHVAKSLLQNIRHSDVVGRLGGDEFGVLLSQVGDDGARIMTEELAERISSLPVEWDGGSFNVSIAHGY
jgi:diguanylate cyclase (GGDEF)-like protein